MVSKVPLRETTWQIRLQISPDLSGAGVECVEKLKASVDFMGFYGDLMGSYSDLMGFNEIL